MRNDKVQLVVKRHRPWKNRLIIALLALGAIVGGGLLYDFGSDKLGYQNRLMQDELRAVHARIRTLEQENDHLRGRNTMLERAAEIDHLAYGDVDNSLQKLQREVLELKEELAFYRKIVTPGTSAQGLRIAGFRLKINGQPRSYHYEIILTRFIQNQRRVSGIITMKVLGVQDGKQIQLTLKELGHAAEHDLKFRFKYFLKLENDIVLPTGFDPQRIILQVIPKGRKKRPIIERTFSWRKSIT